LPKDWCLALKTFGNSKNEVGRKTQELTSITLLAAARDIWILESKGYYSILNFCFCIILIYYRKLNPTKEDSALVITNELINCYGCIRGKASPIANLALLQEDSYQMLFSLVSGQQHIPPVLSFPTKLNQLSRTNIPAKIIKQYLQNAIDEKWTISYLNNKFKLYKSERKLFKLLTDYTQKVLNRYHFTYFIIYSFLHIIIIY